MSIKSEVVWSGICLRWAYQDLLPYIFRRTRSIDLAWDILHDGLIRFTVSKSPNRDEKPRAYLRTIVQNLIFDEYSARQRFVQIEDDEVAGILSEGSVAPSAEFLADMKQRLTYLQSIIDYLPPRCREAFWLYRIEGHPQNSVAQQLGISVNMVERHIIRAIADLSAVRELLLEE